jgi:hypothetical protein
VLLRLLLLPKVTLMQRRYDRRYWCDEVAVQIDENDDGENVRIRS